MLKEVCTFSVQTSEFYVLLEKLELADDGKFFCSAV